MRRYVPLVIIGLSAIIIGGVSLWYIREHFAIPNPPVDSPTHITNSGTQKLREAAPQDTTPVKTSLLLPVPFTAQAPTANWDELHNEACEEAAAIMSNAYFKDQKETILTPSSVETEITQLTEWQDKSFGYHLDTTSDETAQMIASVYGLTVTVEENISEQKIKDALIAGKLVLISTNGRLLGNPNYKQPGPLHHMLLIKGFTKDNFITNDSGTRKGLNYAYTYETLSTAAGDWDHNHNTVDTSKKLLIIVSK